MFIPVLRGRHEVDKNIFKVTPVERRRSAVDQLGRLIPHHFSRLQEDLVQDPLVVEYLQRPVRVHLLVDVEDGGDDVSPQVVEVGREGGPSGVLPQPVGRGARQL